MTSALKYLWHHSLTQELLSQDSGVSVVRSNASSFVHHPSPQTRLAVVSKFPFDKLIIQTPSPDELLFCLMPRSWKLENPRLHEASRNISTVAYESMSAIMNMARVPFTCVKSLTSGEMHEL